MAVNDVYQIVDTQEIAGQKTLNVYYYQMTAGSVTDGANAADVTQAFIDNILPGVVQCQVNQVHHISIKATNLFDDTDAHEQLISEYGITYVDYTNTFDAYGFRITGDNSSVRSGAKRIPGVSDFATTDGVVTDTPMLGFLNDLATGIGALITYGTDALGRLAPVIVKRILVGTEYKLPTSLGDAVLSFVTDVLVDALVTSQVSRKVGRGE